MSNRSDGEDEGFDRWVAVELHGAMDGPLSVPAPAYARFRTAAILEVRRMSPIRLIIAAGIAAMALGGGTAFGVSLASSHGTVVNQAAGSCATAPADVHGDCVSTVAQTSTSTSGSSNSAGPNASGNHGAAVASAAAACPTGPGDAHGDCVSAVAKANHGHSGTTGAAGASHAKSGKPSDSAEPTEIPEPSELP